MNFAHLDKETQGCLYLIAACCVVGIYLLLQRKEKAKLSTAEAKAENTTHHDPNDVWILILWIVTSICLYPTNEYCSWFVIVINCILLWCLVYYNYGWQNLIVKII